MTFKCQIWIYKASRNIYSSIRLNSDTMAEGQKSHPYFPLFAPMKTMEAVGEAPRVYAEGEYDWIMCLMREANPEKDAEKEFCSIPCGNFVNYLGHLESHHGIVLKNKVDFCLECSLIFKNRVEGVSHFLEKSLMFENCMMKFEESPSLEEPEGQFLAKIFEGIVAIRNRLIDHMMFGDDHLQMVDFDAKIDAPTDPLKPSMADEETMPPLLEDMPPSQEDLERGDDTCDCPYGPRGCHPLQ